MHTQEGTQKSEVALREEAVLAFWREHDIFNKSLEKDAPNGEFVFYDGPPFATGLPHYGHILAGTIKDAIPRFWTMNGYRVRRKWGWDCHGLPLENLIEKELGLATKRDIEEYGVQNFNEKARSAVMRYADEWRRIIPRMGRWADMEDDYKTMDSTYTESVWWVFNQLNEKGLVYEGFKSMHLCPRCGTTLSNFEVNQGYKDIKDIAVTVQLPLVDEPDTSLLVWTTTPWTLPGNMAAAVHNDHDYVKVQVTTNNGKEKVVLAKERLEQLGTEEYEVLETFKGKMLVGKAYVPPFDYFKDREFEGKENAWKIYHADYVELGEEGTGAVHLAPAYGEEDMELAKEEGVPIVHHVNTEGHFEDFITDFAGQLVKPKDDDDAEVSHLDADIQIVRALNENKKLFKKENITHSYPHCWRCDTPLLNYATTSWFVEVTKIKDELVAQNKTVHWVPKHVGTNRFGKWLDGARDWSVSRQRYWGAPLPIWRNPETKDYKVFGSLAQMQEYAPKSGNTYLLMRHGESHSNLEHAISTDVHKEDTLTEKGVAQAKEAAIKLKDEQIDLIVVSPFHRTKETAALVRTELGLPESALIVDERLQEIQVGEALQGKSWEEHSKLYDSFLQQFTKNADGVPETRRDVQRRVGALLYELDAKYKNKRILFVGHVSSTFALGCVARGADIERAVTIKTNRELWLENAEVRKVDFTPLPHNDNYELDYHRPYIDDYALYEGKTKLERVPDVFDCWFESGSMPYGQHHYPFENLEIFDPKKDVRYPAQFIAEGLDQTRGWFYSLVVLGTALFGKTPYQNVIVNGLVLAEDGRKMSKSLQNYPDPMDVAHKEGADAMRFYLLSSPIVRAEDLNFSEKGVMESQRKNIGRLHNVLAMYQQYANGTKTNETSEHVLDRWIIARMQQLIQETTHGYKNYELDKATRPITDFIDDLSVWYLRRSRDRLKGEDEADKQLTLGTLRYVLQQLSLVMAPVMPFYAEYLWGQIKSEQDEESVHLAQWPEANSVTEDLLTDMVSTREIVTKALEARAKSGLKVRQPIAKINGPSVSAEMQSIILDEVNAKSYTTADEVSIDTKITPELKAEGDAREFMRQVQDMRKKAGLQPQDRITLLVQTSDSGEALVQDFTNEISKIVGADAITFGDAQGVEVTAGGHSFTVELTKV